MRSEAEKLHKEVKDEDEKADTEEEDRKSFQLVFRCAQVEPGLKGKSRYACTRIRVFYCSTRESSVFHLFF